MADLDDIVVIAWAPLGAPGTGITLTQYTSLDSDRNALLARANITKLDDVPDVVLTSLADGQTIGWHAATSTWINVANAEAVAAVKNNGATILSHAQQLNWSSAFTVSVDGAIATQADIAPVFGTTSGTFRAGNQTANAAIRNNWGFGATGVLSSGTRTLSSTTSDVLVSGVPYDWKASFHFAGRNNVNNGDVTITITGPGGASRSRNVLTVGGVPRDPVVAISGLNFTGTGAGATITATVAYLDNDPTDVLDGYVEFDADPRR